MTVAAAIILPALLLENDDLAVPHLLEDRCRYGGAIHQRRANGLALVVTDHQNFIEIDRRAFFGIELLDPNNVIFGDFVLLAAAFNHCEHQNVLSRIELPSHY